MNNHPFKKNNYEREKLTAITPDGTEIDISEGREMRYRCYTCDTWRDGGYATARAHVMQHDGVEVSSINDYFEADWQRPVVYWRKTRGVLEQ